jgi:hypothetical protein
MADIRGFEFLSAADGAEIISQAGKLALAKAQVRYRGDMAALEGKVMTTADKNRSLKAITTAELVEYFRQILETLFTL